MGGNINGMRPLIINDRTKIENVYSKSVQYLEGNASLYEEIGDFVWAYNEVGALVPQTIDNFWSGHFFPFSESYFELENSSQFCMQGFYRHAFSTLRSVLELALIGIYFDRADKSHVDSQEWLKSIDPTPFFKNALNEIFKLDRFKEADYRLDLQEKVKLLYDNLSDYVHIRGYRFSTSGATRSNFNTFNDKAVMAYVKLMKRVVLGCITLIILKYPIGMQELPLWQKFGLNPPMGGFLDEGDQMAIFKILDARTKEVLTEISNQDSDVQSLVKSINDMPDLTEDEIKRQGKEHDKMMEEHRYKGNTSVD
jgi:hypothetical protein